MDIGNGNRVNSQDLPGGRRGSPPAPSEPPPLTSIDLRKPGDLALVNRAVVNGWDAPQHVRDQICDQLVPAMDGYVATMKTHPTASGRHRATQHVIKVVMLALKMDATHRIAEGQPAGWFPYLRKRYPEKRRPRRRRSPARQEAALRRLLAKLNLDT